MKKEETKKQEDKLQEDEEQYNKAQEDEQTTDESPEQEENEEQSTGDPEAELTQARNRIDRLVWAAKWPMPWRRSKAAAPVTGDEKPMLFTPWKNWG